MPVLRFTGVSESWALNSKPYYEAGVESNLRVIIAREKQMCTALLAGNHDQIRRFLAGV